MIIMRAAATHREQMSTTMLGRVARLRDRLPLSRVLGSASANSQSASAKFRPDRVADSLLGLEVMTLPYGRVVVGRMIFFFSSRRRHTRCLSDWSSDVCSSD